MTSTLSQREKQVLQLISDEHNSKEIASQLYISEHTVISHRQNLLMKMDAKNTAGLVRRGFETGVLQIQSYMKINQF